MIFHLAEAAQWELARSAGVYTWSTLGRTLADEGFIHCSEANQWAATRARFYTAYPDELVLLSIDEDMLTAPLVREIGNPVTGELFPHLYGSLNLDAVVATQILSPPHAATSEPSSA
jgi:uncharacterized protein (DUF952 family)